MAGVKAGLLAGTVFVALEVGLGYLVHGHNPWVKSRMIAAIALGPEVLAPPAIFDPWILLVATVVHYGLSILYALIGVALLFRFRLIPATVLGGLLGLLLYLINFYGFTFFFPWFAEGRSWTSMFTHIAFGMIHGCGCKAMQGPPARRSAAPSLADESSPVDCRNGTVCCPNGRAPSDKAATGNTEDASRH